MADNGQGNELVRRAHVEEGSEDDGQVHQGGDQQVALTGDGQLTRAGSSGAASGGAGGQDPTGVYHPIAPAYRPAFRPFNPSAIPRQSLAVGHQPFSLGHSPQQGSSALQPQSQSYTPISQQDLSAVRPHQLNLPAPPQQVHAPFTPLLPQQQPLPAFQPQPSQSLPPSQEASAAVPQADPTAFVRQNQEGMVLYQGQGAPGPHQQQQQQGWSSVPSQQLGQMTAYRQQPVQQQWSGLYQCACGFDCSRFWDQAGGFWYVTACPHCGRPFPAVPPALAPPPSAPTHPSAPTVSPADQDDPELAKLESLEKFRVRQKEIQRQDEVAAVLHEKRLAIIRAAGGLTQEAPVQPAPPPPPGRATLQWRAPGVAETPRHQGPPPPVLRQKRVNIRHKEKLAKRAKKMTEKIAAEKAALEAKFQELETREQGLATRNQAAEQQIMAQRQEDGERINRLINVITQRAEWVESRVQEAFIQLNAQAHINMAHQQHNQAMTLSLEQQQLLLRTSVMRIAEIEDIRVDMMRYWWPQYVQRLEWAHRYEAMGPGQGPTAGFRRRRIEVLREQAADIATQIGMLGMVLIDARDVLMRLPTDWTVARIEEAFARLKTDTAQISARMDTRLASTDAKQRQEFKAEFEQSGAIELAPRNDDELFEGTDVPRPDAWNPLMATLLTEGPPQIQTIEGAPEQMAIEGPQVEEPPENTD
ncbi:MAG: hypothetical protein Q9184_002548 [Pyrenodesmia sp. 2 TL-2023]